MSAVRKVSQQARKHHITGRKAYTPNTPYNWPSNSLDFVEERWRVFVCLRLSPYPRDWTYHGSSLDLHFGHLCMQKKEKKKEKGACFRCTLVGLRYHGVIQCSLECYGLIHCWWIFFIGRKFKFFL